MSKKLEYSRGEVLASKYEVVDRLDSNPLGIIYRVKHLTSGRYLRLVLLEPRVASATTKDAVIGAWRTAKALDHANILKVGELGDHEGVGYYTCEDFDGTTLRELIQEYRVAGRQFELREAAQITIQILEALKAVHDGDCTIRALRPEHVLVNLRRTGPRQTNVVATVKLLGVGFWDLLETAVLGEDEFTRGEAQYMAPELKSFEPDPTPRCDVYSVGVIFYELLVGTAPVGTFQLPRQRRPELPVHIDNVIELALANAPDDRYPSAQDFIADIHRTFQDATLQEDEETTSGIHPMVWALGATLVVAVAVALFNARPDPIKQAHAADASLRKAIAEEQQLPSEDEVRSVLAKHPENMIYVPAGPYLSGRLNAESTASAKEPLAERKELPGFLIDAFEYPNRRGAPPRNAVTWSQAQEACAAEGKRLCSADEWEKACKGVGSYAYTYGDTYDPEYCGEGLDDAYVSGTRAECRSSWGAFDMSGNFREWTSSERPGDAGRRLVKGGMPRNPERGTRCAFVEDLASGFTDKTLSFRCCRDLDAPPVTPAEPPAE